MVESGEGSFEGFNMFCVRGIPGCSVCDRKLFRWCWCAASREGHSRWWDAGVDQEWQAEICILCNAGHAGFKASQDFMAVAKTGTSTFFLFVWKSFWFLPLLVLLSYLRWLKKKWNVLFWDEDAPTEQTYPKHISSASSPTLKRLSLESQNKSSSHVY